MSRSAAPASSQQTGCSTVGSESAVIFDWISFRPVELGDPRFDVGLGLLKRGLARLLQLGHLLVERSFRCHEVRNRLQFGDGFRRFAFAFSVFNCASNM